MYQNIKRKSNFIFSKTEGSDLNIYIRLIMENDKFEKIKILTQNVA